MTEIDTSIREESQTRYLTYAMSVVTGRALPDVRDGLKPVQRRILYAMSKNLNLKPSGSHRKSAAVVGEVLARYHPHGDVACYDAMVRMAQDFSLRYPLVDGQGNFGSLDGDSPAAYRYTEAKLRHLALDVLGEIEENTVDFRENFDATVEEPVVLPSKAPQLLMNGASGIAVGMATNIPPHNVSELVKGLLALLDNSKLTAANLTNYIKGPDFPTGCLILNSKKELTNIYQTGKGSIRMRGDWKLEALARGKQAIVVHSIPYGVNKSTLVSKIADLIIAKKIPQLIDIRDESTEKVRIVLELAPGADPELAAQFIYKRSPLETHFAVNLTALTPNGRPKLLSLKECLQYFLDFREQVVRKRLQFERENLLARVHILEGLVKIYDVLDEALKLIRKSDGRSDAAKKLQKRFKLSEIQSFAVVDMRIYQLSKTSILDIRQELKDKKGRVKEIDTILKSKQRIKTLIKKDLTEVDKMYGDKRRSKIIKDHVDIELEEKDFIVQEDVFAIITSDGWLKRIRQNNDLTTTRLRDGDSILSAHAVSTLDEIALFTSAGYLYLLSVRDIPASSGYGSPVQKLLKFRDGERIVRSYAVMRAQSAQSDLIQHENQELKEKDVLSLVSAHGMGYALKIDTLESTKKNGKRIMKLREDDELVSIEAMSSEIAFFTEQGYGLVVKKKDIPVRSNPAIGVILISVKDDDIVVESVSSGTKRLLVELSSGKERELSYKDLPRGRRGLRGKKVVSRAQIISVSKKV